MNRSRVGFGFSLVIAAGAALALAQPGAPSASQSQPQQLADAFDAGVWRGRMVAISFLSGNAAPDNEHISEFVDGFKSLAGVVNVAVVPSSAALPPLSADASNVIVRDAQGEIAKRYGVELKPGDTSIVVVLLDDAGQEVHRARGAGAEHPRFAPLADKIRTLTTSVETKESNLDKGLALQGYDPVSYLDAPKPSVGSSKIQSEYRGVKYRFSSAEHRARFNANPEKYLPAYGGWCATAMATGDKVEVSPTNYKVTDGRVFLFYKGLLGNAIKDWNKDEKGLTQKADDKWNGLVKKP